MSRLRPCLVSTNEPCIPDEDALWLIRAAVRRRESLIYGKLRDNGGVCAIGGFFDDYPKSVLTTRLIDEVAGVNDSLGPRRSAKERRKEVLRFLNYKIKLLLHRKDSSAK
jgi:hypothetical protein